MPVFPTSVEKASCEVHKLLIALTMSRSPYYNYIVLVAAVGLYCFSGLERVGRATHRYPIPRFPAPDRSYMVSVDVKPQQQ